MERKGHPGASYDCMSQCMLEQFVIALTDSHGLKTILNLSVSEKELHAFVPLRHNFPSLSSGPYFKLRRGINTEFRNAEKPEPGRSTASVVELFH